MIEQLNINTDSVYLDSALILDLIITNDFKPLDSNNVFCTSASKMNSLIIIGEIKNEKLKTHHEYIKTLVNDNFG